MIPRCFALVRAGLGLSALQPTAAQDHGHDAMQAPSAGTSAPAVSPYVGLEHRSVKALSDQQIADLRAGRGMGLALPAELNGYPGRPHVLELADALQLSQEQQARTKTQFEAMKAETVPIGERFIAAETALDHLFADRTIARASLDATTSQIGAAQGELRAAHLRYHLAMMEILSPGQVDRYVALRGHATNGQHDQGRH